MNYIFDFDSTLVSTEILEEIAKEALKENKKQILKQIKDITNKGMEGKIPFSQSLRLRIDLLNLKKSHLQGVTQTILSKITPSIKNNLEFFKKNYKSIYIVSGGFKEVIIPVGRFLGIPNKNIFANSFIKKENSLYLNPASVLSKDKGKVKLVKSLNFLPNETVIIGDGYSDYEIKEANLAKYFIAFTENIERIKVVNKADFICKNFKEVIEILKRF